MMHSLRDFEYELPAELIAQTPARPRDHARLLVYDRRTKQIKDDYFYNLDKYLNPKTTIVLNDSKVEKCRLKFGKIEIFVLETLDPFTVRALVYPGRKFVPKSVVSLAGGILRVETAGVEKEGIRTLKLNKRLDDPSLDKFRRTPLPPYIKPDESLASDYQTVYADPIGSKAAPTAGLHFTPEQLKSLGSEYEIVRLTLHVGLGTFAPVKSENISKHRMHPESFDISAPTADGLNRASHITAVGTTTLRVLESVGRPFEKTAGSTAIFITPGYEFKAVDSLLTNFHLPGSTLLMVVSAFLGSVEEMHMVYAYAIERKYRFYSFGDAMIIS